MRILKEDCAVAAAIGEVEKFMKQKGISLHVSNNLIIVNAQGLGDIGFLYNTGDKNACCTFPRQYDNDRIASLDGER
jgi:hypothetical protein